MQHIHFGPDLLINKNWMQPLTFPFTEPGDWESPALTFVVVRLMNFISINITFNELKMCLQG